jgi:2-polyprenyl-3-methyl-5-hydroxy-6-metoxy-1,4-benzoquinol methylase
LFSLAVATNRPDCLITGIDHDAKRIDLAKQAAEPLANIEFFAQDLRTFRSDKKFRAVAIIDSVHYFPPSEQIEILNRAFDLLEPGGTLLLRSLHREEGLRAKVNRLYEKIATGVRFTKGAGSHYFRTPSEWMTVLEKAGFSASWKRCSHFLFSDVAYVGIRRPESTLCEKI